MNYVRRIKIVIKIEDLLPYSIALTILGAILILIGGQVTYGNIILNLSPIGMFIFIPGLIGLALYFLDLREYKKEKKEKE